MADITRVIGPVILSAENVNGVSEQEKGEKSRIDQEKQSTPDQQKNQRRTPRVVYRNRKEPIQSLQNSSPPADTNCKPIQPERDQLTLQRFQVGIPLQHFLNAFPRKLNCDFDIAVTFRFNTEYLTGSEFLVDNQSAGNNSLDTFRLPPFLEKILNAFHGIVGLSLVGSRRPVGGCT